VGSIIQAPPANSRPKAVRRIAADLRDLFTIEELRVLTEKYKVGFLDSARDVIIESPFARNLCPEIMGPSGCTGCPALNTKINDKNPTTWVTCHSGLQRGLAAIAYNGLPLGWITSPVVLTPRFRRLASGASLKSDPQKTPSYGRPLSESKVGDAYSEVHAKAVVRRRENIVVASLAKIKSANSESAIWEILLDAVKTLFGDLKAVYFYVEKKYDAEPGYHLIHWDGQALNEPALTPLNQGYIGKAISERTVSYVQLRSDDRIVYRIGQSSSSPPKTMLTIPVCWGLNDTFGGLQLQSDKADCFQHRFDREAVEFLTTFAGEVFTKLELQKALRITTARAETTDEWNDFIVTTLSDRTTTETEILQKRQEVFDRFVKKLRFLAGDYCIATSVRLLNPLTQILGFVAGDEAVWLPGRIQKLYAPKKGAAHKALTMDHLYYPDVSKLPEEEYFPLIPETKSLWVMRFEVHGELTGIVSIDWHKRNACSNTKDGAFRALLSQLERVLEALLDREARYLKNLLDPISLINEQPEALQTLVTSLKDLLSGRACSLFLDRRGDRTLELAATTDPGRARESYSCGPDTPPDRLGITGWVARHGKSMRIRNRRDPQELREICQIGEASEEMSNAENYLEGIDTSDLSYLSFLAAPMIARGRVLGVLQLSVKNGVDSEFTHQDETFLQEFANRFARVLDARWVEEDGAKRVAELQEQAEYRERIKNAPGLPQMSQILCDQFMIQMEAAGSYLHIHDEGRQLNARVASGILKVFLAVGLNPELPTSTSLCVPSIWESEAWEPFRTDFAGCLFGNPTELIQAAAVLPIESQSEIATLVLCWQTKRPIDSLKRQLSHLELQASESIETALQQVDARKKLGASLKSLKVLQEFGLAFSAYRKLEDLCDAILRAALDNSDFPAGTVRLYDPQRGWVRYATSMDCNDEVPLVIQTNRTLRRCLQSKTPFLVDKRDEDWKLDAETHTLGVRQEFRARLECWIAVPLHVDGDCIGAILLVSNDLLELGKDQNEFLQTLGHLATVAIRSIQRNQKDLANKPFEMIGAMLGGFLHVMRNKVTNAFGNLALVKSKKLPEGERGDFIARLERDLDRIREVCEKLVGFSSMGDRARLELVNFGRLFDSVWDDMPDRLRKQVRPIFEATADAKVRGNRNQLEVAVQMLVQNALEAMPDGGVLRCRASVQHGKVILWIADSGKGMDKETKERCLEPFYTTKSKGTGLGLAVVNTIVRNHSGHLTVRSYPGRGTVCRIQFALPGEA
jgi:signal transduction histidine kinase